ncbi:MAG: PAS domain S-box protein [Saprospiraceae bacterium]
MSLNNFQSANGSESNAATAAPQEEIQLLKAVNQALICLLSRKNLHEALSAALPPICEAIGCDGVYLLENMLSDSNMMSNRILFSLRCTEGNWQEYSVGNELIMLENRFKEAEVVGESAVHAEPALKTILAQLNIGSYLGFRVLTQDKVWGSIWLVSRQASLHWTKNRHPILIPFVRAIGKVIECEQAQAQLIAQRDYFKQIIDVSPNPIFIKNKEGILSFVNEDFARKNGYSTAEMIGKPIENFIARPEESAYIRAEDERILSTRKSSINTLRQFSNPHTGITYHLLVSKAPLTDLQGNTTEVVTILTDITESVQTKERLAQEKQFSETITNLIPDWVLVVNLPNRRFDYSNIQYPVLGFAETEVEHLFEMLVQRLHPEDKAISTKFLEQLQTAATHSIVEKDFRLQHKDGRWLHFFERARVLSRNEAGDVTTYLAVIQDITPIKATQLALQQSEAILKATINALPDLKFKLRKDGTYLEFYQSDNENIVPYAPPAAIIGNKIQNVIPRDIAQFFVDGIQRAVEQGQVQVQEYEINIPNQGLQYREARISPINAEEVIAVVRDISERKRAEKALKHSQERYLNFIQHSQEGIYYMNCGKPIPLHLSHDEMTDLFYENAFIEECNDALTKMYGLSNAEMRGKKVIEFHSGAHFEQNRTSFKNLIKNNFQVINEETIEVDVNGKEHYYLNNGIGIIENNHLIGFWGTQFDITERKLAEEALRKSEAWANLIFDSTTDLMFLMEVVSLEVYRCVRVNPAYIKLTGIPYEQLLGKTPAEILPPESAQFVIERYQEAIRLKHHISYEETVRIGDRIIIVETYLTPIFNEVGHCTYLLGVARDITERKRVQQREQIRTQALEMLLQGAPLELILHTIVKGVENYDASLICNILLLDEEKVRFHLSYSQIVPDFYIEAISQVKIGIGIGSCGTAAATGERVIVADIQTHPYWTDFKALAERANLRSCWSEPIKDSAGNVLGTFAIYRREISFPTDTDIEVIKQAADLTSIILHKFHAEATLKANEEKFSSMVHNISDIITLVSKEGIIQYESASIKRILGYDEHELTGKSIFQLLHPDDILYIKNEFYKLIQQGGTGPLVEFRFLHKAGHYIQLEGQGTNQLHNQAIKAIIINSRDITERKKAENALHESRSILKAIINALPDLKFRISKTGLFLDYYESEYENEVPFYPPSEFIGKTLPDVLPSYVAELGMSKIFEAIDTKQVRSFEYFIPYTDELAYYEGRVSPVSEDEAIVTIRNISDRKKVQLALQEKLRELDEKNRQLTQYIESNFQLENFAYIASHDLREPVRTMHSFAQLLKKRHQHILDEDGQKCLDFIISASLNMNRLIEDLLTFSRVTSEEHRVEPIEMKVLLEEVSGELARFIIEKQADILCFEIPEFIQANPTTIRQLFHNLLINAIKFHHSERKPQIFISGIDQGDHWLFEIKDNGIGIPNDMQEKIFQLFKKIHYVKEHMGTGMGLAICKRIVEQHGGEIWVESIPQVGSSFYFTIKK